MSHGAGGSAAAAALPDRLRSSAAAGDADAVRRLLAGLRRCRFSRDPLGRTALHLAAAGGNAQTVRHLLAAAANCEVDSPDGDGCAALQRATADGHEEVVRLLLQHGADVNRRDSTHGNSALHEAAWKGYSRTVRLLATWPQAEPDGPNAGGFTALHLCCQNGHNQSCRELLLAGADPDRRNNYGDTALHTAARYGHAGVTRILISAKCRVSEQNKNGDTALHIAAAMGRRKLTRILLEAGCDKMIRNKQNETARDIALRKDLGEILDILDEIRRKDKCKTRKRSKSKVRFEGKDVVDNQGADSSKPRHWSPYGCHYYPDPEAFPSPKLDSLPQEPLRKGEQYYLDLAGNICKGPVGVGYTCYCAPLFRHLEARMEKDKRELQKAQVRLGQKVAGLEQKLNRGIQGRRSERVLATYNREPLENQLPRSRSLEMLEKIDKSPLQATRSMDELDPPEDTTERPSVKELVARIQQQQKSMNHSQNTGNHSESSDDEDGPLRMTQLKGPMGNSNLATVQLPTMPNYENIPSDAPARSRTGMYSPTVNTALIDSNTRYIEPVVKVQESNIRYNDTYAKYNPQPNTSAGARYQPELRYDQPDHLQRDYDSEQPSPSHAYYNNPNISARLAKLRVLDSSKGHETKNPIEGSSRMLDEAQRMTETPQDTADRDTNNDSGYSTKMYGSSKGNSPSLYGDCLGASSLV